MTNFEEDTIPPSTHICHVCSTEYKIEHRYYMGYPQPPCCPTCDAPMRVSQVPIGDDISNSLLLSLGGAPIAISDDSWFRKLPDLRILQRARTYADIDAIVDEVRAGYSWLRTRRSAASSNDPFGVAERAAQDRLREQLDSGLLEWRLNDLREQAIALLRAEHEHHQYVYAARRGQ